MCENPGKQSYFNYKEMEEVKTLKYLRFFVSADESMELALKHWLGEGVSLECWLACRGRERMVRGIKVGILENTLVHAIKYGSESWLPNCRERRVKIFIGVFIFV